MPDANYAEQLKELEEAVEAVKEAIEAVEEGVEQAEELAEQLDGLTQRIKDAQQNPDSLNADTYADLALALIMVIPDNLPLPDKAKQVLRAVAAALAAFIQGATGLALALVGRTFRGHLRGGQTPEEAAKLASVDPLTQRWLLAQHKVGLITAEGDKRPTKMPWVWLWEKLTGLLGLFLLGIHHPRLAALAALAALLVVAGLGFWLAGGGDDGQTVAHSQAPTATSTVAAAAVSVRSIVSTAGQVVTEYVVEVEGAPPRETITYTWSGATCGTATPNRNRYAWDHREQVVGVTGGLGNRELGRSGDCNHRTDPAHGSPLIAVDITAESFTARCTFQGAGSGTGPACSLTSKTGAR